MLKPIERVRESSRAFTLLELMVVISILGVLTAIVIPVLTGQLGQSQEGAYGAEVDQLQKLVDQFFVDEDSPRYNGQSQFPIMGAAKGVGPFYTADADLTAEVIATSVQNPAAGTQGGTPVWDDNLDGVRAVDEEILNDEDTPTTTVGWHVAPIVVGATQYYVDSRDFFVDFDLLVDAELLREAPKSASSENCSVSACTGSYTYYVDAKGTVKTLLNSLPVAANTGFQEGVYP